MKLLIALFLTSLTAHAESVQSVCGYINAKVNILSSQFVQVNPDVSFTVFTGTVVELDGVTSPVEEDAVTGMTTTAKEVQVLQANQSFIDYKTATGVINSTNPLVIQQAAINWANIVLKNCRQLLGM